MTTTDDVSGAQANETPAPEPCAFPGCDEPAAPESHYCPTHENNPFEVESWNER